MGALYRVTSPSSNRPIAVADGSQRMLMKADQVIKERDVTYSTT
jgi:hypothetical protein